MNEELEHLRQVGGRIIEERCHGYKLENQLLKDVLEKNKIAVPKIEESDEKLTKSEEQKLQELYKRQQMAQMEG